MIRDREMDRILGAWAREGVDVLPDRLIDAVLGDVERTRQRRRAWLPASLSARRPWLRLVAVVAALLALAAAVALLSSGASQPRAKAFRGGEALEPGRYVIDAPFDFHLAIDVPAGWLGIEEAAGWTELAVAAPEPRPNLVFTTVVALRADPCRPELGIQEPLVGESAGDLVDRLASLAGIGQGAIRDAVVGGRPARLLTVLGGPDGVACANGKPFMLWSLGEPYPLEAGARHRIWVVEVDGRRLVVAARDLGPATRAAQDLDGIVGSILLGADAPARPSYPPGSTAPYDEAPIPTLPPSGRVAARPDGYLSHFAVYAYGADRLARLVARQHDWVLPVLGDWTRTSHGMERQEFQGGTAALALWSVRRVYVDPCHWQTSSMVLLGPENVADYEMLAKSLSGWWGPNPDEGLTGDAYTPPPFSPSAGTSVLQGYPGTLSRHLELVVPVGLDLALCDGGEYRIWEDHDGTARTAQPGERINLRVSLLDAGVVVLEGGYLPGASEHLRADLTEMLDSSWIGAPAIGS